MDLIDALTQLSARIPKLQENIQTEEATKNALILPVLQALGYNVFDPFEVVPEFTADVGTKKNEKVDYVIMKDGKPAILIECKCVNAQLNVNHASQLFRYFSTTEARFAILTNGLEYQFFTDIEAPNKMDDRPFFEFSMLEVDTRLAGELGKFSKPHFDLENILSNASELKYKKQLRAILSRELAAPSDELVRMLAKQVFNGSLTAARMAQFTTLVAQAFREWVNLRISERLQTAIDNVPDDHAHDAPQEQDTTIRGEDGIVTTDEEQEAFRIVRAILAKVADPERVALKDTKSYCGVLLDNNVRKPLCRFLFTPAQKTLILVDRERHEERIALESIVDIYKHADKLEEYAKAYL